MLYLRPLNKASNATASLFSYYLAAINKATNATASLFSYCLAAMLQIALLPGSQTWPQRLRGTSLEAHRPRKHVACVALTFRVSTLILRACIVYGAHHTNEPGACEACRQLLCQAEKPHKQAETTEAKPPLLPGLKTTYRPHRGPTTDPCVTG